LMLAQKVPRRMRTWQEGKRLGRMRTWQQEWGRWERREEEATSCCCRHHPPAAATVVELTAACRARVCPCRLAATWFGLEPVYIFAAASEENFEHKAALDDLVHHAGAGNCRSPFASPPSSLPAAPPVDEPPPSSCACVRGEGRPPWGSQKEAPPWEDWRGEEAAGWLGEWFWSPI
jgi:hypothetical protein